MNTYRIYKHPAHSVSTVVKVGFCWPAFILGPLWFLLNKMWLTFLLSVAFTYGAPMVSRRLGYPSTQSDAVIALCWTVFVFLVWFLTGKVANFLLGEELKATGYEPVATVLARNADEARKEASRMRSQPKAESTPHLPPQTEVADEPQTLPPRPPAIRYACQLVLTSLLLDMITLAPGLDAKRPDEPDLPFLATLAIVVVLGGTTVWLTSRTYAGRNWGRCALLTCFVVGWQFGAGELVSKFQFSPVSGAVSAVSIGMEIVAAWLLFAGAGGRWYKKMSSSALRKNRP